jgi:hypothetical protein
MSERELIEAIFAEFERLDLRVEALPGGGLASSADGATQLLAQLRAMAPGVRWRDVFPDFPAHWEPGRPETWTTPYHPFGPYDYQELPAGPAVQVQWEERGNGARLEALIDAARRAGWPVYGAGLLDTPNPAWTTTDALIVLARGTSNDECWAFAEWVDTQTGARVTGVPRSGDEEYTT